MSFEGPFNLPPGRRVKRIESRQLSEQEISALEKEPAQPAVIAPSPPSGPTESGPSALDPTEIALRRRKRRHRQIYLATQMATAAGYLLAMASLVMAMFSEEESDFLIGLVLGLAGLAQGGIALLLCRGSQLSARIRGHAVAAIFLSTIALAGSFVAGRLIPSDRSTPPARPSPTPSR